MIWFLVVAILLGAMLCLVISERQENETKKQVLRETNSLKYGVKIPEKFYCSELSWDNVKIDSVCAFNDGRGGSGLLYISTANKTRLCFDFNDNSILVADGLEKISPQLIGKGNLTIRLFEVRNEDYEFFVCYRKIIDIRHVNDIGFL